MRRCIPRGRGAQRLAPCALLAGALAFPLALAAQDPEPAERPFGDEVSVGYVLVPVVVRSPSGFVTDLAAEDFELAVDGRPLAPASFESGPDGPISVLFAQDLSGSMGVQPKLDLSRRAVDCFLQRRRPGDRFALSSFAGDLITVDVPFTDDVGALTEATDLWTGYGRTALHDAVAWLPRLTLGEGSMRRAAVLITDGVDNASALDPEAARERVRAAELPVYVLGLSTGDPYSLDDDGDKVFRYADVLNLLAALSGGEYHSVSREDEIDAACTGIVEQLRHQYVLGFPLAVEGPAEHHEISVEVRGRKRRLSFRRGYQGRAPEAHVGAARIEGRP